MDFDYKEYAEAMDEFLIEMEKIRDISETKEMSCLARLCKALRISKLNANVKTDRIDERVAFAAKDTVYSDGESADEPFVVQLVAINGSDVEYEFFPYKGADEWSDFEKSKMTVIAKTFLLYQGRIRYTKLVDHLSYRDNQLGFYNFDYCTKICREKAEEGVLYKYGVGYFNLKRFSTVNQQLGRDVATQIMVTYIHQLQEKLGEDELVCRMGGDSFVVLFRKEKLEAVIDYLKGRGVVYNEDEDRIMISATAGYYLIPDTVEHVSDIFDNASVAYNLARNVKNEPYIIYDEKLADEVHHNKYIEEMFSDALMDGEFSVYYQPKVAMKNYSLAGAEALCRWFHDGRMISPGKFIPALEQSKMITTLDFYMLEHVCRDMRKWLSAGKKVVKVSVNLSRRHLSNQDLVKHIISVVDRYEVPHKYIEFELTETTTDVDFMELGRVVKDLQAAGFSTSVDDFGMGYSSLNLIKVLPWNVLKIDKSFLDPVGTGDEQGEIMLSHVIAMAQEMGLECIVEGVETAEQVKFLKRHNCYLAQGFFFDRPLPRDEFEKRLEEIQIQTIEVLAR